MEIRQPLTQAVESVAQAVEDLAVNAHISLRELKNTVAAVIEKKLPKYAQLKQKRSNNEKIGQLLKTYGVGQLSELPASKYEAFLADISQL